MQFGVISYGLIDPIMLTSGATTDIYLRKIGIRIGQALHKGTAHDGCPTTRDEQQ